MTLTQPDWIIGGIVSGTLPRLAGETRIPPAGALVPPVVHPHRHRPRRAAICG